MIVSKKIKQLKASRDTAPILMNKIDWKAIKPEKNKENIFKLLESFPELFIVDLVNFYCAFKIEKKYKYIEDVWHIKVI